MNGPGLVPYLLVGALLFGVGVAGLLSQRNAMMVLMSAEIILNAALLNILAFWRFVSPTSFDGQVFAIIVVTVGAIEMAGGLGLLLLFFRKRGNPMVDKLMELRR